MSKTLFYDGGVPDAIQKSRQERVPLVVFLKGSNEESDRMEQMLSSGASSLLEDCIVLKLDDDLDKPDDAKFKNAKMFRQFFPTDTLPTLMVMGLNGPALTALSGSVEAEKLLSEIKNAKATFQAQVDALENEQRAAVSSASTAPGTIPADEPISKPSPRQENKPRPTPPTTEKTEEKLPDKDEGCSTVSDSKPDSGENNGVDVGRSGQTSTSNTDGDDSRLEDMDGASAVSPGQEKKSKRKGVPKPLPVYNTTTLQFKLTNGESMRAEFASDATLREVCGYLDLHRTDGFEPYVLETLYPRQKLGVEEHGKTLKDLDLVPRSTVMLTALHSSGQQGPVANAQNTGLGGIAGGVLGGVGKVISFVNPFPYLWGGGGDRTPGEAQNSNRSNENGGQASGSGVQNIPKATEPSGVRRRPNWGGNVHGLRDESDSKGEDDPSKNKFWNGNSTQYGGHED